MQIGDRHVGLDAPTYFIADIAANHDGDLARAFDLIAAAKESGADCAKFQHFRARHIVSDVGFRGLGAQLDHQSAWRKSVFEVYEAASLPWEWTAAIAAHAQAVGIEFMSAPYDLEAVEHLNPHVQAFKVGSGDINWIEELELIASKGKPVILATGSATLDDVQRAMNVLRAAGVPIVLMQCNTNYTGSHDNIAHTNLLVLRQYAELFPDAVLGLSDHTPGHLTVIGAVALGARVIEKHFTDDTRREGPDHGFSMDPQTWSAMVAETRDLEGALGNGIKQLEANESETVIVQRRCVRVARDLPAGHVLSREDVEVLRPAPPDAIPAHDVAAVVGRRLSTARTFGEHLRWSDLVDA